jgi:hypothetical protein
VTFAFSPGHGTKPARQTANMSAFGVALDESAHDDERAERVDVPKFSFEPGTPRVTQVLERAHKYGLVFYGKKFRCSPRKLVLNVLRHLTEPYGYRWVVVPENRYAFEILDCAWTHGDGKFFPKLGRVYVNPLQNGVDGGVALTFIPKFLVPQGDRPLGDFLDRVRAAFDADRTKFALWEEQRAWLPMHHAKRDEEDHSLFVQINDTGRGYEDNLTRILVQNLRAMRSTWILVQAFAKRMPKIDTSHTDYPLVRQDVGRLLGAKRE